MSDNDIVPFLYLQPLTFMKHRVAFLDRDGTINVDHGYVCRVEDWTFTERALEALILLRQAGFRLAVVTNQSGIARGYYGRDEVDTLHAYLQDQLRAAGLRLDAIALCPHGDQEPCDCRKPRIGMARQVETQLGQPIDYAASWTIGDKVSDLQFGVALGTRTALIRSRYWRDGELPVQPDLLVASLYEATVTLVSPAHRPTPIHDRSGRETLP